jgi:glutathionylspermidine amidase/synthetase
MNSTAGVAWQCVELARRFWVVNYGVTFAQVPSAYKILSLASGWTGKKRRVPLIRTANGALRSSPPIGALVVWAPEGPHYSPHGHVAVVVGRVRGGRIPIVEQNGVDETAWKRHLRFGDGTLVDDSDFAEGRIAGVVAISGKIFIQQTLADI